VRNVLKECPILNLIPMKFDEKKKKKAFGRGFYSIKQ
jgi:hypothetical protein